MRLIRLTNILLTSLNLTIFLIELKLIECLRRKKGNYRKIAFEFFRQDRFD